MAQCCFKQHHTTSWPAACAWNTVAVAQQTQNSSCDSAYTIAAFPATHTLAAARMLAEHTGGCTSTVLVPAACHTSNEIKVASKTACRRANKARHVVPNWRSQLPDRRKARTRCHAKQQLPPTQLQPKQYAAATAEHSHIRVIRCQLQRSSMCQHRPYSSRHRGRLLKEAHRSLQNSTHNNHAGSNTHAYTHKLLDSDVSSNNRTVSRQCCCCRGLLFSTYAAEVTMVT